MDRAPAPAAAARARAGPGMPRAAGRAWATWSGGQASLLALGQALRDGVRVTGLLTTLTEGRTLRDVPGELLSMQARMLGLPLCTIAIPTACTDEERDRATAEALATRAQGVTAIVHGANHHDMGAYDARRLAGLRLDSIYPLWGQDAAALARRFLAGGHQAVVYAVDGDVLDPALAGRPYDQTFLDALPAGVDPWGTGDAFCTFVHAGPAFRAAIPFRLGAPRSDGRYHWRPLVPGDAAGAPPRNPELTGVPLFGPP